MSTSVLNPICTISIQIMNLLFCTSKSHTIMLNSILEGFEQDRVDARFSVIFPIHWVTMDQYISPSWSYCIMLYEQPTYHYSWTEWTCCLCNFFQYSAEYIKFTMYTCNELHPPPNPINNKTKKTWLLLSPNSTYSDLYMDNRTFQCNCTKQFSGRSSIMWNFRLTVSLVEFHFYLYQCVKSFYPLAMGVIGDKPRKDCRLV